MGGKGERKLKGRKGDREAREKGAALGRRLETRSADLVSSLCFQEVPLGRPHSFGGYTGGSGAARKMSHWPGSRAWVSVTVVTTAS